MKIECPHCNGRGVYMSTSPSSDARCPVCKGRGKIEYLSDAEINKYLSVRLARREKQLKRMIASARDNLRRYKRWEVYPNWAQVMNRYPWHKLSEEKPEDWMEYAVIGRYQTQDVAHCHCGEWYDSRGFHLSGITHWRELPPPPEES